MKSLLSTRFVVPICLFVLVTITLVLDYAISQNLDTRITVESKTTALENTLHALERTSNVLSNKSATENTEQSLTDLSTDEDIRFLFITDSFGTVLASRDDSQVGIHWTALNPSPTSFNQLSASNELAVIENLEIESLAGLTQACNPALESGAQLRNCGVAYMEFDLSRQLSANKIARVNGLLVSAATTFLRQLLFC
jgi:hypothetical protein